MGGDFNQIPYSWDRKGSTRVNSHSKPFHRWVSDFSLIDIALTNLRHTWSSFRLNASFSKTDRYFVSKEWHDSHPKVLKGFPQHVSDHCPLLLATVGPTGGLIPFRFENMWFQQKSFKASILSWWNKSQNSRLGSQQISAKASIH